MNDKKIKLWLWVFVATLAISGGIASFFAQKITLYRGNEPLGQVASNVAKAQAEKEIAEVTPPPQKTNFVPLKAIAKLCHEDEVPLIAENVFSGCIKINTGVSENAEEKIPVPK